jgi:large subunit ribosomal protein L25
MSKAQALTAHTRKRSGSGALNSLRKEGLIPGVVYGKTQESFNVRLNRKEVETVLHHSAAEQILVNLTIEDLNQTVLALIQDVQHNPLTDTITHLDFHAVREDEIIHANIPLELVGEALGVKSGGLLEHLIHNLEIKCLPKDLPEVIQVDVSNLELNGSLHIRELTLPEGVKPVAHGDVMVAMVSEPKVVAEVAPAAEAAPAAADAKAAAAKGAAPAKAGDAKAAPAAAAKPAGGKK